MHYEVKRLSEPIAALNRLNQYDEKDNEFSPEKKKDQ